MPLAEEESCQLHNLQLRLLAEMLRNTRVPLQKLRRMQELYISKNFRLYDEVRVKEIESSLAAVEQKFALVGYSLEELWNLSMSSRITLKQLIENSITCHKWRDEDVLLGTAQLQCFLFQARSFLDLWMVHVCTVLRVPKIGKMSREKFNKWLSKIKEEPFESKAFAIQSYFDSEVFGDNSWGTRLKSLRDKIGHRDKIRPGQDGSETILKILLDWPTINGMTFERLAQDFENGAFELFRETAPILYDLEWRSGPQ